MQEKMNYTNTGGARSDMFWRYIAVIAWKVFTTLFSPSENSIGPGVSQLKKTILSKWDLWAIDMMSCIEWSPLCESWWELLWIWAWEIITSLITCTWVQNVIIMKQPT